MDHDLMGVYAAAVTPLKADYSPDLKAIPDLLEFLEKRGCHGALLLGTTGEGPSFSFKERILIMRAACEFKRISPRFRILAGTGTPSLTETIDLTKFAFSLGCDGVVVLPPYYFKKVDEQGLFTWFSEVIQKAVPPEGYLLGYHIPPVTGIHLSLDLMDKLKVTFPGRFAGIKDSSADADFAKTMGEHFGKDLLVLTGNDKLFEIALESHAGGCITALANLYSPLLRKVWDESRLSASQEKTLNQIDRLRTVLDSYSPYPPILKAMLTHLHGFPSWTVRPPLIPAGDLMAGQAVQEFNNVGENN